MLDEHCHIIWGVDDGPGSRETSMLMLDAAHDAGITRMVCTPHMRWDDFDQATATERFADLRAEALARGIQAELGYEVYYNRLMTLGLDAAPRFKRQGSRDFLFEFNTGAVMEEGWERVVYDLQSKHGLDVVMAHPERYSTVLDDYEQVYRIHEAGVRIQVSAGDLDGGFFNKVAKCARWIMKEGLCDALVSDAHCPEHYNTYAKMAAKYL